MKANPRSRSVSSGNRSKVDIVMVGILIYVMNPLMLMPAISENDTFAMAWFLDEP